MDTRTLQLLDYYRIRDTIAGYAQNEEGQAYLKQREPSSDSILIEKLKKQTAEWMLCLQSQNPLRIGTFSPCKKLFSVLQVEGAALELQDAYALGRFCNTVTELKTNISALSASLSIPELLLLSEKLTDLSEPSKMIFRIVDENGELRDLPEIRAIKSSISKIRRDISSLFKKYTTDSSLKDVLQSDIPAVRGDRQVLAVKSNFRGRIKGIVHEMSQTGQTVYIEPDDIVQKNNDLIQEECRLSIELHRILCELTSKLGEFYEPFVQSHEAVNILDSGYAAAKWGIDVNGTIALNATEDKPFSLIKARHPLLGSSAVPIDISFLKGCKVIIITGPNTGGKTVSLKTAALFAALNQSGFPIPAAEGSVLPVFDQIFADIGDEQSIDQSLSTFSSHMKITADMCTRATEKSLLLLDELGSGTDPQEGGAIAMSILDFLMEKNCMVLVTTHHGILKNYGYTHPSCTNASVDFDGKTLSPTYRIVMGVPGESHALDIAEKSGLDLRITSKAREYIVTEQADVSALIKGLTAKHTELKELEKKYHEEERLVREKRRTVDLKELRLRQKEAELREQGYRKLAVFSDESRKTLENLVRELREGEITRDKTLKVKEFIAELSKIVDQEKKALTEEKQNITQELIKAEQIIREEKLKSISDSEKIDLKKAEQMKGLLADYDTNQPSEEEIIYPKEFAEGVDVFVNGRRGTLVRQDKKNKWIVQFGTLKMSVNQKEMSLAPIQKLKANVSFEIAKSSDNAGIPGADFGGTTAAAVFELRLLGMRYEDAMKAVERQIDLAIIQHLKEFSIIHGKGNGILQQGVQDYLKHCDAVEDFCFARPEDGGYGKTLVKLKG